MKSQNNLILQTMKRVAWRVLYRCEVDWPEERVPSYVEGRVEPHKGAPVRLHSQAYSQVFSSASAHIYTLY